MNILVIRMHRFGDILQLTPMLQGLKNKYPGCKLTFFTSRQMAALLVNHPDVDEIISIPETKYRYHLKHKPDHYARIFNEMYELVAGLKERKFKLTVNRHYEFGAILAYLIGAEQTCGQIFSPQSNAFSNDPVSMQLYEAILSNRKLNRCNLVDWSCRIAGLAPGCGKMYFAVPAIDCWAAEQLLSEQAADNRPLIAVQMGAAKSFRQWGTDNYLQVIRWLIETKGQKVVLLGTEDEKEAAGSVRSGLGRLNQHLIDLTGKTDFNVLGGVLKKCQKLITGDTGTMHMAAAVGTPVIALFYGAAFPWETGPYGTGHLVLYADHTCAPCFNPDDCTYGHPCRKAIRPEHVCQAFEISEAIKNNKIAKINHWSENVRLYLTSIQPGAGQTLVDIHAVSKTSDFSAWPHNEQKEYLAAGTNGLQQINNQLLQKLHQGNDQGFMDLFSEYIDQWIKRISYLKAQYTDESACTSLMECLYPSLTEAMRAMQSQDYSTLSDLVQYDFKDAADLFAALLTCPSGRNVYECEERSL